MSISLTIDTFGSYFSLTFLIHLLHFFVMKMLLYWGTVIIQMVYVYLY